MQDVINIISNVGFPIAMCLLMFWNNQKTSEAINNNTIAITKLEEKLDSMIGGEKNEK